MDDKERELVTYYVTKNRRSPVVALIGVWPQRSALMRSCNAGVKIASRLASDDEMEILSNAPRHPAWAWKSVLSMLRDERRQFGNNLYKAILGKIREKKYQVKIIFVLIILKD